MASELTLAYRGAGQLFGELAVVDGSPREEMAEAMKNALITELPVEVFRELYTAVGFGWSVRVTRLPGIRWLLDRGYTWFARNRLRLTRRCTDGSCTVPTSRVEAA